MARDIAPLDLSISICAIALLFYVMSDVVLSSSMIDRYESPGGSSSVIDRSIRYPFVPCALPLNAAIIGYDAFAQSVTGHSSFPSARMFCFSTERIVHWSCGRKLRYDTSSIQAIMSYAISTIVSESVCSSFSVILHVQSAINLAFSVQT